MSRLDLSFYEELHKRVAQWNCRVGNEIPYENTNSCFNLLKKQAERIVEEANEILEGATEKDPREVMDGVADTLFTLVYAVEIVRKMGYDVAGACKAVCDENDTKYSDDYMFVQKETELMNKQYGEGYCKMHKQIYGSTVAYCMKRVEDGKVLKFSTHKKVELDSFIPKHLL